MLTAADIEKRRNQARVGIGPGRKLTAEEEKDQKAKEAGTFDWSKPQMAGLDSTGGTNMPYKPWQPLSVAQTMNQRLHGPQWSGMTDPVDGHEIQNAEARARGPITIQGGRGGSTGRGGHGMQQQPRSRISSAGVAGGVSTARPEGSTVPGWERSQINTASRPFGNGLTNSGRFGMMGRPIMRTGPTSGQELMQRNTNPVIGAAQPMVAGTALPPESFDPFEDITKYATRPLVPAFAKGSKDTGSRPRIALVGERGPELVKMPANSQVLPNHKLAPGMASYANGTEWNPGQTAFDALMGNPSPMLAPMPPQTAQAYQNGARKQDAEGNWWTYDAATGRGVPENPYLGGRANAPMPRDSFRTSPAARYDDLANRLSALRQEGMSEGRRVVQGVKERQAADKPRFVAGENLDEGTLETPYGNASVTQAARPIVGPSGRFTNAQGSRVGGVNFTGQQGAQTMAEVRQGAANRGNMLAGVAPERGFAGRPFVDKKREPFKEWDAAEIKKRGKEKIKPGSRAAMVSAFDLL